MRKLFSIAVLACFMLISALANIGESYAESVYQNALQPPIFVEQNPVEPVLLSFGIVEDEKLSDVEKDECPCKKDSGATKFVCGVTLALSNDAAMVHPPVRKKMRYAFYKTATPKGIADLLKRPPRTIL